MMPSYCQWVFFLSVVIEGLQGNPVVYVFSRHSHVGFDCTHVYNCESCSSVMLVVTLLLKTSFVLKSTSVNEFKLRIANMLNLMMRIFNSQSKPRVLVLTYESQVSGTQLTITVRNVYMRRQSCHQKMTIRINFVYTCIVRRPIRLCNDVWVSLSMICYNSLISLYGINLLGTYFKPTATQVLTKFVQHFFHSFYNLSSPQ